MSKKPDKHYNFNLCGGLGWLFFALGCVIIFHGCNEERLYRLLEALR